MTDKVRVRFAPSPTGYLHIGGLRTALYNELFARRHGGDFILRIEDTDQSRLMVGAVENLCRTLEKCGVVPNEGVWIDGAGQIIQRGDFGPYIQSERKEKHQTRAQELLRNDRAYYCFCSPDVLEELRRQQQAEGRPTMYDGRCRDLDRDEAAERVKNGETHVIRLKLPKNGSIKVKDAIRGEVAFDWSVIDDQVIIKSDGFPTYHLAAMCDDHDMQITHVLRAEEWLPSMPKHIFIYESFGWKAPVFAHLPLLLNTDRSKLSKRQGDVAVEDYLNKGYLPEALVNFVALLGWNPTGDREIYTHDELAELFDLNKVNKAGAVVNFEKLDWMNSYYLRSLPTERYLKLTRPFVAEKSHDAAFVDRCLILVLDRVVTTQDVNDLIGDFFKEHLDYSNVSIPWKQQTPEETAKRLAALKDFIGSLSDEEVLDATLVEKRLKVLIAEKGWGNGDTLWPLRVALSGREKSPGPFELLATYGKERALQRIGDGMLQCDHAP